MGNVTVIIRTVDDQAIPVPIDGVLVRIFDGIGALATEGTTGVAVPGSGELSVTLGGDIGGTDYQLYLSKDGVSFTPTPSPAISVTDPPSPANDFEFTGYLGMTGQLVTLATSTDDPAPVVIPDVRLRVFTAAGVFITELLTNSLGEADLVLDGDPNPGRTYLIRMFKQGWVFSEGATQSIAVMDPVAPPNTNEFDFLASTPEVPESSNPEMCRLSGFLSTVSGIPLRNTTLRFSPVMIDPDVKLSGFPYPGDPTVVDRLQMMAEATVTTDSTGYVEIELPRASVFDVFHHGYVLPQVPSFARICTPDRAGALLEDVLFPYTASVTYGVSSVDLVGAGDSAEVVIVASGSNDQLIEGKVALDNLLLFESLNEDVAAVEVNDDGELAVTAVGVGTTVITASRVSGTHAPRKPEVPDLDVLDLPVEVI